MGRFNCKMVLGIFFSVALVSCSKPATTEQSGEQSPQQTETPEPTPTPISTVTPTPTPTPNPTATPTPTPNTAPVASPLSVNLEEDATVLVTMSGSDANGDVLSFVIVDLPLHGELSGSGAARTYAATPGYFGHDSFTYKVNDGTLDSVIATVSVDIAEGIPSIVSTTPTSGNTGTYISLYGKYLKKPGSLYWVETDRIVEQPFFSPSTDGTSARSAITLSAVNSGSFKYVNARGRVAYSPLVYLTATGTAPRITSFSPTSAPAGASISITGTRLVSTQAILFGGVPAEFSGVSDTQIQSIVVPQNTKRYVPIVLKTVLGQTVSSTNFLINAEPIAKSGSIGVYKGQEYSGALIATDADSDPLTFSVTKQPALGKLTVNPATGAFTYTPLSPITFGTDSFSFTVNDTFRNSGVATIDVALLDWVGQLGGISNDQGTTLALDNTGNTFVAGHTVGSFEGAQTKGGSDVFVAKLDQSGNMLWRKQLGGSSDDYCSASAADASGNLYIAGFTGGSFEGQTKLGMDDSFLVKLDTNGNILWTKQFGSEGADYTYAVSVDSSNNIYVAGVLLGYGYFGMYAIVSKLDSSGKLLWNRTMGTSQSFSVATSLALDGAGNLFVGGTRNTTGAMTFEEATVTKVDSLGTVLWEKQYGGSSSDTGGFVGVDSLGNLYLTGTTNYRFENMPNIGGSDVYLAKLNSGGNFIWKKQIGTTEDDRANAIYVDKSDNVFLTGATTGAFAGTLQGKSDAYVLKLDPSGNILKKRQAGSAGSDASQVVRVDYLGNVFIAGSTNGSFETQTPLGMYDAFVAKFLP